MVAREYLNDAISNHDWKMFRNRLIDLIGDATFVYATLQAARYHRGMGSLRVTTLLPCTLQLGSFQLG